MVFTASEALYMFWVTCQVFSTLFFLFAFLPTFQYNTFLLFEDIIMARHGTSVVRRKTVTRGATRQAPTVSKTTLRKSRRTSNVSSNRGSVKKTKPRGAKPSVAEKQAAFKKFSQSIRPGGLKKSLGIPLDQKVGITRIRAAAKRPGLVGKQGRAALGLIAGSKFKKKK